MILERQQKKVCMGMRYVVDGWMDGWVDGWMDGWMGGWVGGWDIVTWGSAVSVGVTGVGGGRRGPPCTLR
eukprot:NODE_12950_length_268_cov_5.908676_g12037_i0.p2 GENE.NODE_12950_length_268_cov_5.908676_g12037_i0~~NODE_12950_length_268_cov_5.908676_g12037_i0.p2  ORF type:complete len:70 (+),score=11.68 NODE_12950_length_268_cov_5.908676_g12037_i0:56-265(+)